VIMYVKYYTNWWYEI